MKNTAGLPRGRDAQPRRAIPAIHKKESPFEDPGRLIIFVLHMYKQLTSEQRSQIFALLQRKCPRKEIARIVGTRRVNLVYFVLQRGIVVQAVVLKGLFIPCCTGTLQKLSATIIFFLLLQCFCLFFRALVFFEKGKVIRTRLSSTSDIFVYVLITLFWVIIRNLYQC